MAAGDIWRDGEIEQIEYKKCHDCGKLLPKTEEYFLRYFSKKDQRWYFKCHCRECGKIRSKRWREEAHDKYKKYYTERAKSEKGKASNRKYRESHKEQVEERKRAYRAKHKDEIREYDKKRRTNPETREHVLSMTRRWRANNQDYLKEYRKRYLENHREYFVEKAEARRHREMQVSNTLTYAEWKEAVLYFDNRCAYCGKKSRLTEDHFVPLFLGGERSKENILPVCVQCNSSKRITPFSEWYKKQSFYSKEQEQKILDYIDKQKDGDNT